MPEEEARHALRVLRLGVGDELLLIDGCGQFYRARITMTTGHRCMFTIAESTLQTPEWRGQIHLAMAPTKNMERNEWLAEKATEVGFDELTFLDCRFSERRDIKTARIDKILVAAMKQSHKAWKPSLHGIASFDKLVKRPDLPQHRFIAHCYDMTDVGGGDKPFLLDALNASVGSDPDPSMLVLVGPEGDFSIDEVRCAHEHGFQSVSLGASRLRTETAALISVHLMHLIKS